MTATPAELELFESLAALMRPFASNLDVKFDQPDHYYLDTFHVMRNNKPLFFGAVKIAKRYVSYHLMPVYVEPMLLANQSKALAQRMQGKSCFNFTRAEPALFEELQVLSVAGFELYADRGYIEL